MNWKRGLFVILVWCCSADAQRCQPDPTVMVMPARESLLRCSRVIMSAAMAQQQIGGASPSETANQNLATGAAVGRLQAPGLVRRWALPQATRVPVLQSVLGPVSSVEPLWQVPGLRF